VTRNKHKVVFRKPVYALYWWTGSRLFRVTVSRLAVGYVIITWLRFEIPGKTHSPRTKCGGQPIKGYTKNLATNIKSGKGACCIPPIHCPPYRSMALSQASSPYPLIIGTRPGKKYRTLTFRGRNRNISPFLNVEFTTPDVLPVVLVPVLLA